MERTEALSLFKSLQGLPELAAVFQRRPAGAVDAEISAGCISGRVFFCQLPGSGYGLPLFPGGRWTMKRSGR